MKNPISDNPNPPEGTSLVDTHCHLDMKEFENDFDMVLNRAKNHGVDSVITIGIDLASSRKAIELARKYPCIRASVGIHPHDVQSATDETYAAIEDLIESNHDLVVGYGEIGLDYLKKRSEPEIQRRHFRRQLEMAKKHRLPAIIHDRDAHEDTLRILHEAGPFPNGGVMHCFSGDMDFADKILDLGFHISIPGIVTFKNAHDLHEVAQKVPLTSLLVETDGPFLAPHPWRGKRNEPAYVLYTADYIAKLRDIPLVELAKATTANARSLFRLNTSQPSACSPHL